MRNWTIKDAVAVIQEGKDAEAIKEIAKHFPIFFMAVAKNDLGAVASMMTDKMTVRRLQEDAEADGEDAEDTDPAADTEDAGDDGDLENMSTKELIQLCGKKGIKVPKYGKNKAFYIAALQGGAEEKEAEDEDNDDAEEDDPYAGKNAIQLYSLCKKRGIKVQPKQKANVYLKALKDADAKAEEAEDDAENEDWEEDDAEEEKKPAKKAPAKKAPAKEEKKPAKATKPAKAKAEAEEDDDDDWDL